ncbi:hypothetical protein [Stenotrophomonas sp.]|uniref:hypothetical protein n=1 Tax=Stenotrophomonas sp. TaxID=69392 RepID=UPI0025DDC64A|nr:hypothetical protein [Stenotrophomonas sp.]MBW8373622.1 hypothetical protein [Stenotrophomonas sp.]
MQKAQIKNPPEHAADFSGAALSGLPKNPGEIADRLQRRLSVYGFMVNSLRRDVETLQRITEGEIAGFQPTADERRELAEIAVRLHDAGEVL